MNKQKKNLKELGYGNFKLEVANAIADELEPIQKKFNELATEENNEYIRKICEKGAKKAQAKARQKLKEVYDAIGFIKK